LKYIWKWLIYSDLIKKNLILQNRLQTNCPWYTSTKRRQTSPSAWLPAWLPMVVTSSICSNSINLQVCILISTPKNQLFSESLTYYRRKQRSERWKLEINFSRGSAAALRRWGGQICNFHVAYYLSIRIYNFSADFCGILVLCIEYVKGCLYLYSRRPQSAHGIISKCTTQYTERSKFADPETGSQCFVVVKLKT